MNKLIDSGQVDKPDALDNGSPFDAAFWFQQNLGLEEPKLFLPEPSDPLYVLKAIGPYEPLLLSNPESFNPNPEKIYTSKLNKIAKT